jgi:DNA repair protein RecO (recombination protein O)
MESSRCEGIILGLSDYGEADRLVTLFTLEHGKLKGLAKGAKRSFRRFGGILEPFARIQAQVVIRGGLSRLLGADAATIYPRIREDLQKIAHAGYASEAVDLLLPEGLANARMFRLLAAYLEHLDASPSSLSDRRFFEMNLLNILGYCPALEQCASCGSGLAGLPERFAGGAGGLLCGRCGRGNRTVSLGTVNLLKESLRTGRFGAVNFLPAQLVEAGYILDPAIASQVSRPFKSLAFLREMGE